MKGVLFRQNSALVSAQKIEQILGQVFLVSSEQILRSSGALDYLELTMPCAAAHYGRFD